MLLRDLLRHLGVYLDSGIPFFSCVRVNIGTPCYRSYDLYQLILTLIIFKVSLSMINDISQLCKKGFSHKAKVFLNMIITIFYMVYASLIMGYRLTTS